MKHQSAKNLTTGNTTKALLSFAIPIFIGNLFNLAYNLADVRIIGSHLGDEALAAVGGVSTLSDLVNGFIMGLANGFGVVIARYRGMNDEEKVRKNYALSMFLGILITLVVTATTILGLNGIMSFLNIAPTNMKASSGYIRIILWGMIFTCIYNVMVAALRAIGDAYTPLIFLIISAILNVGFNYLLVVGFNMGVEGAAYATVFSQILAVIGCAIYSYIKYPVLRIRINDLLPNKKYIESLISAGFSMAFMASFVAFGTFSLQTAINSLGEKTIVAHMATRKLTSIFMLPFGVLGTAMATFAGQNYGAGRIDRIKEGIRNALIITYAWCVVVLIVTHTISPMLIVAITDTEIPEIIETAVLYQKVDTLVYFLVPTITILRNSLQGLGSHIIPMISSGIELALKCMFAFLFTPHFGYWAIIFSEPVSWFVMVIPLIICMIYKLKKAALPVSS